MNDFLYGSWITAAVVVSIYQTDKLWPRVIALCVWLFFAGARVVVTLKRKES